MLTVQHYSAHFNTHMLGPAQLHQVHIADVTNVTAQGGLM